MKSLLCAVLLIASFVAADEDNDNWPCYLKRCGKNMPNLGECMVHHANRALDSIFPGDPKIGIPNYVPYNIKDLNLGKNRTFKLHFDEANIIGINNLHVTNMAWNFETKKVDIGFLYNTAIYIDGNYRNIGTFQGRPVNGIGHADLIFVGGSNGGNLTYNMNYDLLKVLGRDYVQIKSRTCTRAEGFRVEFTNYLISPQRAEEDRVFLNKHSDEVNEALSAEIKELICVLVDQALNPVFYNFPLDLIFDSN